MKKSIIFFFLMIQLCANAQSTRPIADVSQKYKKTSIKLNPFGLLIRRYSLALEYTLDNKSALELEFAYMNFSIKTGKEKDTVVSIVGSRLALNYRYYLGKKRKPLKGFYVSPFIEYLSTSLSVRRDTITNPGTTVGITSYGIGSNFGYQWVFGDAISLDIYGGLGYLYSVVDNINRTMVLPNSRNSRPFTGLLPNVSIKVGYCF